MTFKEKHAKYLKDHSQFSLKYAYIASYTSLHFTFNTNLFYFYFQMMIQNTIIYKPEIICS